MKFTADCSAIKKALDVLRPGENHAWGLPLMAGVQIEARGKGVIELTTTDTRDRWESIKVMGQEVEDTGKVVVPFARFKRLMGAMKDDTIEATLDGSNLEIVSGKTRVVIRQSTEERMPAAPQRGVSAVEVRLHGGAMQEALLFASKDYARPVLESVFYDGGSYVSTDSYRLSVVEVPEHAWDGEFLIPRAAAEAMCRLGDPKFFTAWTDQTHLWADLGDAQVVCRLRDGEFPGYKSLIPGTKTGACEITEELRDAALKIHRIAKALGRGKWSWDSPVKIARVDDTTVVLSMQSDENTIEIKALGRIDHEVGFNPEFLADFFTGTDVDSMFGQDSLKPWGLEEPADYCFDAKRLRLLMPVRVSRPDW